MVHLVVSTFNGGIYEDFGIHFKAIFHGDLAKFVPSFCTAFRLGGRRVS